MRWIAAVAVWLAVASSAARADDWSAHRDPFDPAVVARYEAMLAKDPHEAGAFGKLVELYQRYRTLAKLEGEYREKLARGDDWATLVVLARLPRKDRVETAALWRRALAANPGDGLGWVAVGDGATSDPAAARDAYRKAAALVPAAKRRPVLQKLVVAAHTAGDAATVDAAYGELIALAPKDGGLWLDRGGEQMSAKHYDAALASFATADALFGSDPERRLTARTDHASALEALGRVDEALAEYEKALDGVPSGYLAHDLVGHIVDAERRRKTVGDAIARLEKRWPERARGYFEWATLGDLYGEMHDDEGAIAAYREAVAKAPTEVGTQKKLIALYDKLHPEQALAQHERAARVAPGDADLQLGLAKRYHEAQPAKAFATLDALDRRFDRNINVRQAAAALYEQWTEVKRALHEYEAIAAVEPSEPDHLVVLGDAYWRDDDQAKARVAWNRLDKIGTAIALQKHGDALSAHEQWNEAVTPYTKSLVLDGTSMETWYGRARAYEALSQFPEAVADSRRAVALTARATQEDGLRNRQILVRTLGHAYASGHHELEASVAAWRFAFEHDDPTAGYLLAAHHQRLGDFQLHDVLVKLHALVPGDDSLTIALARSFERRRDFDRAKRELEAIAKRTPARAEDIGKLVVEVDHDRERAERAIRWEEEGTSPTPGAANPDLTSRSRVGMRLGIGEDVRDTGGALMDLGLYWGEPLAEGTALTWRLDWASRSDQMAEVEEWALGVGVSRQLLDLRKLEIAVEAGPRFELRYGREGAGSRWDRAAVSGEAALEVLPRGFPARVGVRFDQSLTDDQKASALWLELGVEMR